MKRRFLTGFACICLYSFMGAQAMEPEEVIEQLKRDATLNREMTPEKVDALRQSLLVWSLPSWPQTEDQPVIETLDWDAAIIESLPPETSVSRIPVSAGQPLSWRWPEGTGKTSEVVLDGALFPTVKDAQLKLLSELLWQYSPRHVTVSVSPEDSPEAIHVQTKTSAYLVFRNAYVKVRRTPTVPMNEDAPRQTFDEVLSGLQSRLDALPTKETDVRRAGFQMKLAHGTNLVVGQWQQIAIIVPPGFRQGDVSVASVEKTLVTQETWAGEDGALWRKVMPIEPGPLHFRIKGTDTNGCVAEVELEVIAVEEASDSAKE